MYRLYKCFFKEFDKVAAMLLVYEFEALNELLFGGREVLSFLRSQLNPLSLSLTRALFLRTLYL